MRLCSKKSYFLLIYLLTKNVFTVYLFCRPYWQLSRRIVQFRYLAERGAKGRQVLKYSPEFNRGEDGIGWKGTSRMFLLRSISSIAKSSYYVESSHCIRLHTLLLCTPNGWVVFVEIGLRCDKANVMQRSEWAELAERN